MAAPVVSRRRIHENAGSDGRGYVEHIYLSSIGDVSPAIIDSDISAVDGAVATIQQIGGAIAPVTIGGKAAAGVLTFAANAADGDTVTIGVKVYTFQATLTDVDGNVHIGAAATDSIDNLIAAINLGAGAGTDYATSTTANAVTATAAAGAGDTMDLTKDEVGQAGNAVATTETGGDLSWGAATLEGGLNTNQLQVGFASAADDLKPALIQIYGSV